MRMALLNLLIVSQAGSQEKADLTWIVPLEAAQSAPVCALISGQVARLSAQEGEVVAAGDTLFWLDDTELRLIEEEARLSWERSQRFLERVLQLHNRIALSAQELEEAQYQAATAHIRHQRAQLDLSRSVILAPLSGQVAELQVQKGSLTSPRQGLCQILVPEDLKAALFIPVDQMAGVRLHQQVIAWSVTAPNQRLTGRLVRLSPIVDPHSGSCKAEALFPGAGKHLKPGTVAQVRLE